MRKCRNRERKQGREDNKCAVAEEEERKWRRGRGVAEESSGKVREKLKV